jgi:hypothetical protein
MRSTIADDGYSQDVLSVSPDFDPSDAFDSNGDASATSARVRIGGPRTTYERAATVAPSSLTEGSS